MTNYVCSRNYVVEDADIAWRIRRRSDNATTAWHPHSRDAGEYGKLERLSRDSKKMFDATCQEYQFNAWRARE